MMSITIAITCKQINIYVFFPRVQQDSCCPLYSMYAKDINCKLTVCSIIDVKLDIQLFVQCALRCAALHYYYHGVIRYLTIYSNMFVASIVESFTIS